MNTKLLFPLCLMATTLTACSFAPAYVLHRNHHVFSYSICGGKVGLQVLPTQAVMCLK